MTKARRSMEEDIKLVDLVIEILDARIPVSSRNPDINRIAGSKKRLILLNKADLADDKASRKWIRYFGTQDIPCMLINARNFKDVNSLEPVITEIMKDKIEKDRKKGYINTVVRAMVAGIPNSGKSTFINSFAKRSAAKTGNKPGVTKGRQWIKISKSLELLDTPGILWPRFDSETVGEHLAITGAINDDILNKEQLACRTLIMLNDRYPELLEKRYDVPADLNDTECEDRDILHRAYLKLTDIAVKRNCVKKGGEADSEKAARLILDDLRSGRTGRISLELPEDEID
ncbi:MAG: ribosome biogenesis GTPase YlqF [Lachnospiraceae bacterium]|nr:ribosome biogenesis GTPase YlqF [Lachnospiraceae bacterium]